jgi:hypothetical protein
MTGAPKRLSVGNIEKALNLAGMQINRQNTIGPSGRDDIGDQLGRNWRAWPGLSILPGIAEIGQHSCDPLCRRPAQRIADDQQFHQIVIGRIACRLNDKHILTPDVFMNFDENFFIGKATHTRLGQGQVAIIGNSLRQGNVRIAGNKLHESCPAPQESPVP